MSEPEKNSPKVEDQSRNGVKVKVTRYPGGTVVEAACQCFGIPGRVHSSMTCPMLTLR